MRLSLRRQPRGRHALGAAVTAIPSAPAKPAPAPAPVPVSVPAQPWPPADAVVSAPQPPRPAVVPSPAVPAVPGAPAPAPAEPLVAAPSLPLPPVQPIDLDTALLDLAGPLAPPVPSGPRVELGFADGSFRTLEPDSSAAQQLSELVELLTHRD